MNLECGKLWEKGLCEWDWLKVVKVKERLCMFCVFKGMEGNDWMGTRIVWVNGKIGIVIYVCVHVNEEMVKENCLRERSKGVACASKYYYLQSIFFIRS